MIVRPHYLEILKTYRDIPLDKYFQESAAVGNTRF